MSLMGSLGLENISADPNEVPDGAYDGDVFKSEYVLMRDKDTINHVVTYRVTEGDRKGAQRAQWYKLGENPRNAAGEFPDKVEDIATYKQTMSDSNKQWYKKLFTDLGIPEDQVPNAKPEDLVGKTVSFGVKTNNGYKNVNWVRLRTPEGNVAGGTVDLTSGITPF
jgi:DNA-directed RNA polymerase subunit H (RpoH/RPB5)